MNVAALMRRLLGAFGLVQGWLEAIRVKVQPRVDRWLADWKEDPAAPDADFVQDADYFMIHQEPLRARVLVKTILIALALFIMWTAVAVVDEITKGEGKVIPSSQIQVLQSLDGGIVAEINVKEGQVVDAGQILLRVDPTRFESSVRENRTQYLALTTKVARLRALSEGLPFVPPPEVLIEDPKTVQDEQRLYETARSNVEAQVSIARQQLVQRQQELSEMRVKREQASQAYELTAKELALTKPLINSGAVSEVELLRLERDTTRFRGERDMAAAQILRSQAAMSEASRKIEEVELNARNEVRKELADTMAKLNAFTEGGVALADKVKHAAIRSPVKGTVKRLLVNTVGGVVQPGRDLVEVVPLDDALILEAKVAPKDIAFLRPGQSAMVKFTAYDFSTYGGLEAKLENIGADSITDEKGNTFFLVKVRTNKSSLGANLPIIPGMVAQV
ncbi:MAG: HlyD family type I secretion periplasmic adaptor subunit, partial [Sulfuritalea sp.]|nr:HlyD family type I secretion periplasmic adaptor subunit [Sulfuritalea sp.]